jgi:hypothetical protein
MHSFLYLILARCHGICAVLSEVCVEQHTALHSCNANNQPMSI